MILIFHLPSPYPLHWKINSILHHKFNGSWQFEWMNTSLTFFTEIYHSFIVSNGTLSCLFSFVRFTSTFKKNSVCMRFVCQLNMTMLSYTVRQSFGFHFTNRLTLIRNPRTSDQTMADICTSTYLLYENITRTFKRFK